MSIYQENSYEIAEEFSVQIVEKKWGQLLQEMMENIRGAVWKYFGSKKAQCFLALEVEKKRGRY